MFSKSLKLEKWTKPEYPPQNFKIPKRTVKLRNYTPNVEHGSAPLTQELEYNTPSSQVILPSKIARDLGVYLNSDIGWSAQVNQAVQSANTMANWVLSVFSTRSESVMLTLCRSLIRSRL